MTSGITLEVSQREEEGPRIFFFPLGTEELYKVHVKNDSNFAAPSASPHVVAGKPWNINLWIFSVPRLPASLSMQFPRKCQLKHAAAAAAWVLRLKRAGRLDGFGEWPRFLLSPCRRVLKYLRCDGKCFWWRRARLRLHQAVNARSAGTRGGVRPCSGPSPGFTCISSVGVCSSRCHYICGEPRSSCLCVSGQRTGLAGAFLGPLLPKFGR